MIDCTLSFFPSSFSGKGDNRPSISPPGPKRRRVRVRRRRENRGKTSKKPKKEERSSLSTRPSVTSDLSHLFVLTNAIKRRECFPLEAASGTVCLDFTERNNRK